MTPLILADETQTSQRAVSVIGWGGAVAAGLLLWILFFNWLL